MAKKSRSLGVDYALPLKSGKGFSSRPFATSTVAVGEAMKLLGEMGHTFESALSEPGYWYEEKELCQKFIDAGYGHIKIGDWIK